MYKPSLIKIFDSAKLCPQKQPVLGIFVFDHITVLQDQLVAMSLPDQAVYAIDCTAGGGGHTELLIKELRGDQSKVIAFDRDILAINHLNERFEQQINSGQLVVQHTAFSQISAYCEHHNLVGCIDAIIADIGVSSPQIDNGDRGFSFMHQGPLDMRMDQDQSTTAADIVNTYEGEDLQRIFKLYGEEPFAKHFANMIIRRRQSQPFTTTEDLASYIAANCPYRSKSKKHPATKIFQALRIEVNQELEELQQLLFDGFKLLAPGGRLGIITFHSLEDRIVKQTFKDLANPKIDIPKEIPLTQDQLNQFKSSGRILKPFPYCPQNDEISSNPRARSAKLRVIEKNKLS